MNKEICFKQYGDKTVVSKYPDMSGRVLSAKQKEMQERMFEANAVTKSIQADEELAKDAQVRLNVTRNKLYTALIKEYFKSIKDG